MDEPRTGDDLLDDTPATDMPADSAQTNMADEPTDTSLDGDAFGERIGEDSDLSNLRPDDTMSDTDAAYDDDTTTSDNRGVIDRVRDHLTGDDDRGL